MHSFVQLLTNGKSAREHVVNTENIIRVKDEIVDNDLPERKRAKPLSLEEYEAALDEDYDYGNIDPNRGNDTDT
ncbi:hypothetical protein C0993_000013 [Termitomyces sp. T159_Od127]|nr:hypothetical protein C0993_000013 [Termitomyces sp. T159_Od127]